MKRSKFLPSFLALAWIVVLAGSCTKMNNWQDPVECIDGHCGGRGGSGSGTLPLIPQKRIPDILSDAQIAAYIDSVGIWHNQYLDTFITVMQRNNYGSPSMNTLVPEFDKASHIYYKQLGVRHTDSSYFSRTSAPNDTAYLYPSGFSSAATHTLGSLYQAIDQVQQVDLPVFLHTCDSLKLIALHISNQRERVICGSAISVAKNSAMYWGSEKGNAFLNFFRTKVGSPKPRGGIKLQPHEKTIVKADVKGAIKGAVAGGTGGAIVGVGIGAVPGALGGAVLFSGVESAKSALIHAFPVLDWFL